MKTFKKFIVFMLFIFAVFGFVVSITEIPAIAFDQPGVKYCNIGATEYCWINQPFWECSIDIGGINVPIQNKIQGIIKYKYCPRTFYLTNKI